MHRNKDVFIEVKSVSLVVEKEARFPDAPTERGTKHAKELISLAQKGKGAAVVFVIQRRDAEAFAPNWDMDPQFAKTLVQAEKQGVKVYAYRSRVSPKAISIKERVPVILNNP
jgi:sugar fermentation stimulation protein A